MTTGPSIGAPLGGGPSFPSVPAGAVVVGCDGSWFSGRAAAVAARVASSKGVLLVLLTVIVPRSRQARTLHDALEAEQLARQYAEATLQRAGSQIPSLTPAPSVRAILAEDVDAAAVRLLARTAGLLVLGSHGTHGQVALCLGSTSAELARRFRCPILVASDRPRQPRRASAGDTRTRPRVVVGLDGRSDWAPMLWFAAQEAATRQADVVAVHGLGLRSYGVEDFQAVWARWHQTLGDVHLPREVGARLVVTRDEAASALVLQGWSADLVVVGTRGGGRLTGLVRGSVSRAVLDSMPADVMVVAPGFLATAPSDQRRRAEA